MPILNYKELLSYRNFQRLISFPLIHKQILKIKDLIDCFKFIIIEIRAKNLQNHNTFQNTPKLYL